MRNYGEQLKQIRKINNYSTNDIKKATGISTANQAHWENNKTIPNIYFIEKLADFYGITIDELIGRDFIKN